MKNGSIYLLVLLPAAVVVFRAAAYLQGQPHGILVGNPAAASAWYPITLKLHVGAGMVALMLALIQLLPRAALRRPGLHRIVGLAYGVSVLVGGLAGLAVAPYSIGGWVSGLGFACLSVAWLATTGIAVFTAVKGRWPSHRYWATLSAALTLSAVTFRLMLLVPLLTEAPFFQVYRAGSWLCWIVNLTVASVYLRSKHPAVHA